MTEKDEISQLVKGCMKSLNLPPHDYGTQQINYSDKVLLNTLSAAQDIRYCCVHFRFTSYARQPQGGILCNNQSFI